MAEIIIPRLKPEIGRNLCLVKGKVGEYGGYRQDILIEELVDKDKAIFICTVCKGIMFDASLTKEGNQVCYCCVNRRNKPLPNEAARTMISSLSCLCPLSERGCNWQGILENCMNHLDTCGYVYESCKLECGVVLPRDECKTHMYESCNQRIIQCEHCNREFKVCVMIGHLTECPKMKLECELGCHMAVNRENMAQHVEQDCLEKEVACPFVKYNCEVALIKLKDLDKHLEEKETKHLGLKLTAMELKLTEMENVAEEQKRDIEKQRKEIETNFCAIATISKIQWSKSNIPVEHLKRGYRQGWVASGYYKPSRCTIYIRLYTRNHRFYVRFQTDYDENNRRIARAVNAKFIICLHLPTNAPTMKVYSRKLKVWGVNVRNGCERLISEIPQADGNEISRLQNLQNGVINSAEIKILVIPDYTMSDVILAGFVLF